MNQEDYQLNVDYNTVLQLVSQLPDSDKEKILEEVDDTNNRLKVTLNEDKIKNILRIVRPFLSHKLGKYTHQKSSTDWSFVGFAFTKKNLGYIFGINVGFFKKNDQTMFNYAGMNILVRSNGGENEFRNKILNFFRANLADWANQNEKIYSYPARGDEGVEVARYKKIEDFNSPNAIVDYIQDCILKFHQIYPTIIENAGLFEGVVRAAPKWDELFVDICKENLE
jgi:hypothetical protein